MYEKSSIVLDTIENAKKIVQHSRQKYDHLMKVIEFFISDNDIIVKSSKNYFFDLFTTDMYNLPKQLTDNLYKADPILAKYVTLVIKIYKYHSRIIINGITFVHFTYINSEIRKNILRYTTDGIYTNKKYQIFGPEIELITLYADLVNPTLMDTWPDLYTHERMLAKKINNNLKYRIEISGGNENNIIDYTLNNFISDKHVIIGQLATMIYQNYKSYKVNRIQIITENSFDVELKNIKKIFPSITYTINNLKIPTNLNLHKLTVSIYKNKSKRSFLDIYDAGNYELIPYTTVCNIKTSMKIKSCLQIGSPFVIKRFRLIDIWASLYMINAGYIPKESNIVDRLIEDFVIINNTKITDLKLLFPITYIGYLEDVLLIRERLAVKLKVKFIAPYIPSLTSQN